MKTIEYLRAPHGVKDVSPKEGIVIGYASTFGNADMVDDIVTRGAFKRTLTNRGAKVKALWQHDAFQPIGIPTRMTEDDTGLYTETRISMTRTGRDALKLVEDGVITDLSIGFDTLDWAYDEDGHRLLKELRLWEYSLVTFPANPEANILGTKSPDAANTMARQMLALEKSLTTGDWHDDDFAEALALQLKQWRAALTTTPSTSDHAPPPPAVDGLGPINDLIKQHLNRLALADTLRSNACPKT